MTGTADDRDAALTNAWELLSRGKFEQARSSFVQARSDYKHLADHRREAHALRGLGEAEQMLGRHDQARDAYGAARCLYDQLDDHLGEASVIRGLADLEYLLGRHDQARDAYATARTLFNQLGHALGEANVLCGLAELEIFFGRHRQARDALRTARSLYEQLGDRPGQANVLAVLGDLEYSLGQPTQARDAFVAARKLYAEFDERLGQANVLCRLAELESSVGHNDLARNAYVEALTLYKDFDHQLGEANVLRGLGDLDRTAGNPAEAREAYTQALALYKGLEDRLGQANILCGLGNLEGASGHHDRALTAYAEARALYKQIDDRLGEANVLRGLAELEYSRGRPNQAREVYVEARVLYKQIDDRLGEANVLGGLGELESLLGHLDQARAAFVEQRRIYHQINVPLGEANALASLGELERIAEHPAEARKAYAQALTLYQHLGHRLGVANILGGQGELERMLGHPDEARGLFANALTLFTEINNTLGAANVLRGLGDLESSEGHHARAREAYARAVTLYEGLDHTLGEANAVAGLAQVESAPQNPAQNLPIARQLFERAAQLFQSMGMAALAAKARDGAAQCQPPAPAIAAMPTPAGSIESDPWASFVGWMQERSPTTARALVAVAGLIGVLVAVNGAWDYWSAKPRRELEKLGIEGNESDLFARAELGDTHVVDLLLRAGVRVHAKNANGKDALTLAARRGHAETTSKILQHCRASTTPCAETMALQEAVQHGHPAVVELLRQNGVGSGDAGQQGAPQAHERNHDQAETGPPPKFATVTLAHTVDDLVADGPPQVRDSDYAYTPNLDDKRCDDDECTAAGQRRACTDDDRQWCKIWVTTPAIRRTNADAQFLWKTAKPDCQGGGCRWSAPAETFRAAATKDGAAQATAALGSLPCKFGFTIEEQLYKRVQRTVIDKTWSLTDSRASFVADYPPNHILSIKWEPASGLRGEAVLARDAPAQSGGPSPHVRLVNSQRVEATGSVVNTYQLAL